MFEKLITALTAIATGLDNLAKAVSTANMPAGAALGNKTSHKKPKSKSEPKPQNLTPPVEENPAPPVEEVREVGDPEIIPYNQLREIVTEYMEKTSPATAQKLIVDHGASKLSNLAEDKHTDLYYAVKAKLEALKNV